VRPLQRTLEGRVGRCATWETVSLPRIVRYSPNTVERLSEKVLSAGSVALSARGYSVKMNRGHVGVLG